MPDTILTSAINTVLSQPTTADFRTALGLGTTDSPTFAGLLSTGLLSFGNSQIAMAGVSGWIRFGGGISLGGNDDASVFRDAAGILAQRNGTNAQAFRVYNTYTDAINYERAVLGFTSNVLRIGTENAGAGAARDIAFVSGGATAISISTSITLARNTIVSGFLNPAYLFLGNLANGAKIYRGPTDGTFALYNGVESSNMLLSIATSGYLKARNITDTAFTNIQGKLTTDSAYLGTVTTPTGYLVIYDSTGTGYRIPASGIP